MTEGLAKASRAVNEMVASQNGLPRKGKPKWVACTAQVPRYGNKFLGISIFPMSWWVWVVRTVNKGYLFEVPAYIFELHKCHIVSSYFLYTLLVLYFSRPYSRAMLFEREFVKSACSQGNSSP